MLCTLKFELCVFTWQKENLHINIWFYKLIYNILIHKSTFFLYSYQSNFSFSDILTLPWYPRFLIVSPLNSLHVLELAYLKILIKYCIKNYKYYFYFHFTTFIYSYLAYNTNFFFLVFRYIQIIYINMVRFKNIFYILRTSLSLSLELFFLWKWLSHVYICIQI